MMRLNTALAAAGLVLALAQPAAADGQLSSQQLRNLVPGRFAVTLLGVWKMTVTLHPGGNLSGLAKGSRDTGRWGISGNRLCISWTRWLGGQNKCSALIAQAGYYQGTGFTVKRI